MAIDYSGTFPCAVRASVSDTDLLRMDKARNRAQAVLALMREDPRTDRSQPESEWRFAAMTVGPDGPREAQSRIGDLLS